MENKFCALGCSPSKQLYIFPSRKYDEKRRKAWLDFFDMEEPNIEYIFACDRHFSRFQTTTKGIRAAAVPDIPIICNGAMLPFPRKSKDWRKNVVVVTPRDPEYTIYRHETGVFPQNLFNISESYRPVIQMPIIKPISSSISTQTNTRFCGLVQISDIKEEYRLNCFYCCEMFDIEKWPKFLEHLKKNHFRKEEAFRMTKYLSHDHDYTSITLPSNSSLKSCYKTNMFTNTFIRLPPSQPMLVDPIILPPLLAKPEENNGNLSENILKNSDTSPPSLLAKPLLPNKEPFNINLADKLIKLLNETVLSPNFIHTEEDNILIIRNKGSKNIETSNFLTNFMNSENNFVHANKRSALDVKLKSSTSSTLSSKYTRPIYTINYGQQDIPSRRYSLSRFLPPLPKNKKAKLVQKRIAQQTLKNIDVFENIYKTVKTRPPKLDESENTILKDFKSNKGDGRQILNPTPLSRCLKRTISQNIEKKLKSTEIVFEYTPKNIMVTLLEAMKNYPVLWQFHDQPFNKMYSKAIEELCKKINERWSLNITLLKMRRSLNRILRFYRFMLPCESIDKFEEYFDKLALFLPTSLDEIPRARCVYCFICYKKDSELRKHIRVRHKALKWPYKCQNCLERFRESDEYELHKRLPHYEEVFKCEQCDKRFNRRNLFNKHVSSHEKSKQRRIEAAQEKDQPIDYLYICDVCNRQFKTQPELNRHKIFHNLTKFKCELCQKEYCSKMSLKLHLKRHRKELDFICEVCGKGFIRGVYLKAHMETHTGAKITCNICNLKLRKCSLSRHLRLVHIATEGTIESTFRAKSHRYKKFITPKFGQIRNRSSETAPRRYNCKVCKINFDRLKELKDHNKQVHFDVERTPCRICNIEFIHMQNLKRHYRLKHKLHVYQIFKLVHQNEDLDTVMAIKADELEAMTEFDFVTYSLNNQNNVRRSNAAENENYFEQGRIHSDKIQDEIMKAVENIDNEEIKVDDDHSMNDFFTDFLTHSYK